MCLGDDPQPVLSVMRIRFCIPGMRDDYDGYERYTEGYYIFNCERESCWWTEIYLPDDYTDFVIDFYSRYPDDD